ncbi:hypothetical protein ACLKA7_005240, partial [Drosophila subpalustris]
MNDKPSGSKKKQKQDDYASTATEGTALDNLLLA